MTRLAGTAIGEDPLQFNGGSSNLHCYAADSPANLVDPTGLIVKNFDPEHPIAVKPENGPWQKLPPCMEWSGSPDGLLMPGANDGPAVVGPWVKIPGKTYTPANSVYVNDRDQATCISGTCLVFPIVVVREQPRGGPADNSWNPGAPTDALPDLPGIRPIPGCKPKSKSG